MNMSSYRVKNSDLIIPKLQITPLHVTSKHYKIKRYNDGRIYYSQLELP